MTPTNLAPRASPQQARSRATVDRVLETSAELLEEVGLEGFNTNLVAERAGVSHRAIYRYFPNKFAILTAMTERVRHLERGWIGDLKALASFPDWRDGVCRAIDGYYDAASQHRGYSALRAASQAVPVLRALDDQLNLELEADLAAGLRDLGVRIDDAHLKAVCRTIIEAANRILDLALQCEEPEAKLLVRELKHMIVSQLADYVDQGVGRAQPDK